MTLKEALLEARSALRQGKVEDAPLEAEILLRHTLGIDRVQLYLDLGRGLTPEQEQAFRRLVQRRLTGEPAAYITGHREFYGHDFEVGPAVLVPRPETEILVEKALEFARLRTGLVIADIGTGCGAIAVSLALELPGTKIYATDISAPALDVAQRNARRHGVENRITFLQGDMLAPLPETVDLIVSNPPYVRTEDVAALRFEPALALDGGENGLDKVRRLCVEARDKLRPGGALLLEIGMGQAASVTGFLASLFTNARIETFADMSGIDRVVRATLTRSDLNDKLGWISSPPGTASSEKEEMAQ